MPDFESEIMQAVKTGLHAAIKDKLTGYNSPLDKMLADVMATQGADLRTLLIEGITSAVGDTDFREQIKTAMRHKLAKVLVEKFGGELEKQVNTLKSDPVTRARITLAIEEIVKTK